MTVLDTLGFPEPVTEARARAAARAANTDRQPGDPIAVAYPVPPVSHRDKSPGWNAGWVPIFTPPEES